MPADWQSILGNDFFGRVRFERHFHCPTGLTEQDQVFIAIEEVDALGSVQLNGQHVGDISANAGPTRFDITILLQQRNRLEVVVDLPRLQAESAPLERPGREQLAGGLIGEVALQIESPDHE
jgi:beta-galactosidase/beta-glucuronidase